MPYYLNVAVIENENGQQKKVPWEHYIEWARVRGWKLIEHIDETQKVSIADLATLTTEQLVDMLKRRYNQLVPKGLGRADFEEMIRNQRIQDYGRKISEERLIKKQKEEQYGLELAKEAEKEITGLKQWHELKKKAKKLVEDKGLEMPSDQSAEALATFIKDNE